MSEQRERFEEWWESELGNNKAFDALAEHAAWRAWQVRCPDGWQCVPKEPTNDMLEHGFIDSGYCSGTATAEIAWEYLLSAAPKSGEL